MVSYKKNGVELMSMFIWRASNYVSNVQFSIAVINIAEAVDKSRNDASEFLPIFSNPFPLRKR